MNITKELWAKTPAGEEINIYTFTNSKGAVAKVSELGAGIVSIIVPDKDGKMEDVVLGYENPLDFIADGPYMGRTPGRYANRIAAGKFTLEGKEYTLAINNGPNHLHGGPTGFMNRIWESRIVDDAVEFMYYSEDGEEGYPGNLKVVAHYEWSEDNALKITFTAQTDATTVVNLTNHAYFNLDGEGNGTILDHVLKLNCSEYLPTDPDLIPLGDSEPVAGTPMDFVNEKKIGRDIKADFPGVKYGKGYDNCYVVDGAIPGQLQTAAEVWSEKSGRCMEVITTQPALQVYSGNWIGGCPQAKNGHTYEDYSGFALESQHYPDSPNHPDYPTTVLKPGETFQEAIIYAFSVKE